MPKEDKPIGRPVKTPGGGNLLARIRRDHELSQLEAAALLGISRSRLSQLERAEKLPGAVAMLASLYLALEQSIGKEKAGQVLALAEQIRKTHG